MPEFVDEAQLHARAGDGGAGSVSFRREAHVAKGGPDGGDGGRGGSVWLRADSNAASLLAFRDQPFRRAPDGTHGKGGARHGASGRDTSVQVPVGTVVRALDGEIVADLATAGDSFRAAEGGRGGRGNTRFLTNKRRAPAFAEQGERGEDKWYDLELKLLADVALVGFPNAGKSTLISRLSAARPKIADYPFTTLIPNLGVVRHGDSEYVVADIPGLIEGASEGRGLGHRFLRHIERTRVLVVLIDLAPVDSRSTAEQERVLLDELGRYRPELLERPRIVLGSKADVATLDWDGRRLSAVTGDGVRELSGDLAELVQAARATPTVSTGQVVLRPEAEGVRIERGDDGGFVVIGREALRAVALSDLTNLDALSVVHRRLARLGVDRALARAGAKQGDVVHIGGLTFEYDDSGVTGR